MRSKAIITAASNKYFPSLLNFLLSIEDKYPISPDIYIYDLGLSPIFKKYLEKNKKVHILKIPNFTEHWRSCYTWKTYILNTSLADLNLYIDAGCQILKNLDPLFEKIEKNNYLLVDQGEVITLKDISPPEYFSILSTEDKHKDRPIIAAGIFGFKETPEIKQLTQRLFDCGLAGLCLGFSKNELWKNKGVNKNQFIRDAKYFRHDTTVMSLLVWSTIKDPIIESVDLFSGEKNKHPEQYLWNLRMNYSKLAYLNFRKSNLNIFMDIYIQFFLLLKKVNRVKFIFKNIKNKF